MSERLDMPCAKCCAIYSTPADTCTVVLGLRGEAWLWWRCPKCGPRSIPIPHKLHVRQWYAERCKVLDRTGWLPDDLEPPPPCTPAEAAHMAAMADASSRRLRPILDAVVDRCLAAPCQCDTCSSKRAQR